MLGSQQEILPMINLTKGTLLWTGYVSCVIIHGRRDGRSGTPVLQCLSAYGILDISFYIATGRTSMDSEWQDSAREHPPHDFLEEGTLSRQKRSTERHRSIVHTTAKSKQMGDQ